MIIKLGSTSKKRLNTCCPAIQEIIIEAVEDDNCPLDFGVVCGFRGKKLQDRAEHEGKSNAKWGQSDHNVMKGNNPYSFGIDLAPYCSEINNYIWNDMDKYNALATHIMSIAHKLGYHLEWGGNYKLKGGSNDPGHFSLILK